MTSCKRRRHRGAAVFLAVAGTAAQLPGFALAQLLPGPGGGVSIESPGAGNRVFGPATVTATVSGGAAALVSSVQFKVDGFALGPADTTAPYAVSWDTSVASDGWHTLTAVGRSAMGAEFASAPVTVRVANVPPPPVTVTRYEDTDASVTFGAGWVQRNPFDWLAWSGGSAMQSSLPGAQATFAFNGTSVTWIGMRGVNAGIARVLVDGNFVADVDLFARRDENTARVFTVGGLTPASHTLTIEVTGRKHPDSQLHDIVIDAFDVPATAVSHLQDSDPAIVYTAGWTARDESKPWSGGDATITATGAQATLTFTGTEIRWIGYRGPDAGIARVYLDGGLASEIDAYSPGPRIQDVLFTATNLTLGMPHTLMIESTGRQNAAATGALIVVDAFDVTALGERFEETEWAVSYTGYWPVSNQNKPWSEGTAFSTSAAGARATLRFTGTGVAWIGFRAARTGIARVYVDGTLVANVDTYVPAGEGFQDTVFSISGLASGLHTLTIEVTGTANPAATNNYIVVDAFDVQR